MDHTPIVVFNFILMTLFTVFFSYQAFYMLVGLVRGEVKIPRAKKLHTYAFLIAAHNEEPVIANLVQSIKDQDYPADKIDVFVIADACTDNTAEAARRAGAIVYERNDLARKGKSWVLDYAVKRVLAEYPGKHDGFFIFDADNLLSKNYVSIMNDAFDQGFMAVTSYRNSKNFDSSWISSAYATWFIREARYLNNARMRLGTSCAVSGSGFLVSADIMRGMNGWHFHTLTEDIQFSTFCAVQGVRIGYAPAEFYDEQPLKFKASWDQRMRWTKGFYQVFFTYCTDLLKSIFLFRRFAAYDLLVTVGPAMLLSLVSFLSNIVFIVAGTLSHGFLVTNAELEMCVGSLVMTLTSLYGTFFVMGLLTTITERKHIHVHPKKRWRIITNLFTFPLFMFTYIPITVAALFKKVEWVPTKHDVAITLDDVVNNS